MAKFTFLKVQEKKNKLYRNILRLGSYRKSIMCNPDYMEIPSEIFFYQGGVSMIHECCSPWLSLGREKKREQSLSFPPGMQNRWPGNILLRTSYI